MGAGEGGFGFFGGSEGLLVVVYELGDVEFDDAGGGTVGLDGVADGQGGGLDAAMGDVAFFEEVEDGADVLFSLGGGGAWSAGPALRGGFTEEEAGGEASVIDPGDVGDEFFDEGFIESTLGDGVDGLAVGGGDGANVFGRAAATFDFEGVDAGGD